MRRNKKRTLSLLLTAVMLLGCVPAMAAEDQTSGTVPITITSSAPSFSVTVSTTLPIHMDAYGDITCGDITIINNSAGPVQVEDTRLTALNGWTLVDYATTTFTDADKGQHRAAIQLDRGNGITSAGKDSGQDIVPAGGGQQTASVAVKLPYQGIDPPNEAIAQVVFVLGWHRIIPATGLTITGENTVLVGRSTKLTATKTPSNSTNAIAWSSSNNGVATVNNNGVVQGVSTGTATITASCDGITATKTIATVPEAPASMEGVKLTIGSSNWSDLTWPAKAATNLGSPSTNVFAYTVTFTNSLSSSPMDQPCSVTIPLVDGWEISNPQMEVTSTGGSTNNDHRKVNLGGSNGSYGYYFSWPNFSGPSLWEGDYTFKVTYNLVRSDIVYLRGLTITGDDRVDVGSTIQLTATKLPANTTDTGTISWSSSNTAVATVNSNGIVTGVGAGTTTITVSCKGVVATKEINTTPTTPKNYSFTVLLEGPAEANCTGGRYAQCSGSTYITGIFGGFNSASGTYSITLPNDLPASSVDYVCIGSTEFTCSGGNTWTYDGYLPGGSNINILIRLVG